MYKDNFVVAIKSNGKILRETNNCEVNLPFGSCYSILLKNKHCRKALVSIEVDGKDVLNGNKLIVNSNSSEDILGFMKDTNISNKFKFIHKTNTIKEYRGDRLDDGLVRVSYTFERVLEYKYTYPNIYFYDYSNLPTYDTIWTCSTNTSPIRGCSDIHSYYSCNYNSKPNCYEGITVNGGSIDSKYSYAYIGSLEDTEHVIILHLKGVTKFDKIIEKPIYTKTKIICATCGKVSKSNAKFCSRCGTCLE